MKRIPLIIAPSPKRSFSILYLSEQLILASLLLIKTCHITLHNVSAKSFGICHKTTVNLCALRNRRPGECGGSGIKIIKQNRTD